MKAAVIFYSLEGNTKYLAEQIAKRLDADLIELHPKKAYPTGKVSKYFWGGKSASFEEAPPLEDYRFDPQTYDTVVVGSPLWAWKVAPPVRTFLRAHDLSGKRVAAFISCGGGNPQKAYQSICAEVKQPSLSAELTVVNPLQNRAEAEKQIADFCAKLSAQKGE